MVATGTGGSGAKDQPICQVPVKPEADLHQIDIRRPARGQITGGLADESGGDGAVRFKFVPPRGG